MKGKITRQCRKMVKEAAEYIAQDSLEEATSICKMPGIGAPYKNGLRKIRLGKFRYNIFYKIAKEKISFVGIWHTSRGMEFES